MSINPNDDPGPPLSPEIEKRLAEIARKLIEDPRPTVDGVDLTPRPDALQVFSGKRLVPGHIANQGDFTGKHSNSTIDGVSLRPNRY